MAKQKVYTKKFSLHENGKKTRYNLAQFANYVCDRGYVRVPRFSENAVFYSDNMPMIIWSQDVVSHDDWEGEGRTTSYTCETLVKVVATKSNKNLVDRTAEELRTFLKRDSVSRESAPSVK